MKLILRLVFVLAALVAVAYGAGLTMPRDHVASSRIMLTAPRDSVWSVLRRFGDYPKWDSDFTSSVRAPDVDGHEAWTQESGGMTMTIKFTEVRAPSRLVTEIVTDESSAWGGIWTYELKDNGGGTEVTITEQGWIKSPIFRVMMKAMGTHKTMDGVLKHLGAKFGEQVTPEHVG